MLNPPSRLAAAGVLAASALFVTACQQARTGDLRPHVDAETVAQLDKGQRVAEAYCSGCHAVGRADASPHPEAPALRNISETYPVAAIGEALAEGIMVGHPDMPVYAFEPAEIDALIAYLENIQALQTG